MADWKRTLKLWPEYGDCDSDDTEAVRALARVVAKRLNALEDFHGPGSGAINTRRLSLVQDFLSLGDDPKASEDDFNRVMVWLWQWADETLPYTPDTPFSKVPKVCWVSTQEGM